MKIKKKKNTSIFLKIIYLKKISILKRKDQYLEVEKKKELEKRELLQIKIQRN